MKIQRGFKFRLKSLGKESNAFWQQAGACRFIWNFFLKRQEYRRSRGHYVESFQTMCSHLTQLKKEVTWLKTVDSTVLQQVLKDLYRAYQDGFDKSQKNKRLPTLKKKHKSRPSFRYTQRVTITHGNRVYLPKLGTFGFHCSRDIIGKIKNTTVGYDSGHWYISFQTEYTRTERPHQSSTIVGIDLGVNRHTTLSSGFYVDGFKLIKDHQQKLTRFQRQLARKVKFSSNWQKAKVRINKLHCKISRIRHDLLHKLSTIMSQNHAVIVFEKLQVKHMTKSSKGTADNHGSMVKQKSGLNKSILDQGWGKLIELTTYKQAWRNDQTVKVNPAGTSQTCSCCGYRDKLNRQTQAVFHCIECGHTMNADDNASLNIEAAGHVVLAGGAPALASALKRASSGFLESQPLLFN